MDFDDDSRNGILVLDEMLTRANIPHEVRHFDDGWQLFYPTFSPENRDMTASECSSGEVGFIEIMGPHEESSRWHLTAQEVFDRIDDHFSLYYYNEEGLYEW